MCHGLFAAAANKFSRSTAVARLALELALRVCSFDLGHDSRRNERKTPESANCRLAIIFIAFRFGLLLWSLSSLEFFPCINSVGEVKGLD